MELKKRISDDRIRKLIEDIMKNFGEVGYGLGSQTSQIECTMIPNPLDHMVKEKLRIKGYGRYMDDGYLIHHSKEYLEYCLEEIRKKCKKIGIILNEKKTKILPIDKGFIFLKTKFTLTDTGRVLRKVNKDSAKRMQRKLKSYIKWLQEGNFSESDVRCSYNSWIGHMNRCNSYRILKKMRKKLERALIGGKIL